MEESRTLTCLSDILVQLPTAARETAHAIARGSRTQLLGQPSAGDCLVVGRMTWKWWFLSGHRPSCTSGKNLPLTPGVNRKATHPLFSVRPSLSTPRLLSQILSNELWHLHRRPYLSLPSGDGQTAVWERPAAVLRISQR